MKHLTRLFNGLLGIALLGVLLAAFAGFVWLIFNHPLIGVTGAVLIFAYIMGADMEKQELEEKEEAKEEYLQTKAPNTEVVEISHNEPISVLGNK